MVAMRKLGYNTSWLKSQLGHEVIWSYNTGKECFLKPHIDYYSLLESEYNIAGSIYSAQGLYKYMDSVVDDGFYILLERDIDDWISDIINSGYARRISMHRGLSFSKAVKEIINEKLYHDKMVKEYFYNKKNFISLDVFNEGLSLLVNTFGIDPTNEDKPALDYIIDTVSSHQANITDNNLIAQSSCLEKDPKNYYLTKYESHLNSLVDFCVKGEGIRSIDPTVKLGVFVDYDYADKRVSPSDKVKLTGTHGYVNNPAVHWKYRRVASALNELINYGLSLDITIDMQDARRYGIGSTSYPRKNLITYCRRKGADNLILWPLPGYHTIGADNFLGGYPRDCIPFNSKKDIAIWRGAFSGHCSDVINDVYENPAHQVIDRIAKKCKQRLSLDSFLDTLRSNIRFNFVYHHLDDSDVDAYLVANARSNFLKQSVYADYFSSKLTMNEIYGYKYIVCLRGHDTASNFLLAASSNSVALKEEDGWEVFYSVLFEPWEHYIPLSPGGLDVGEKVEWARNNPAEVARIISNANELCCYLSRNDLRKDMCRKIVQRINSLRG